MAGSPEVFGGVEMTGGSTKTVLLIAGMRGNASRVCISDLLVRVKGVRKVSVSLVRAEAVVEHDEWCDPRELVRAVEAGGCRAAVDTRDRKESGRDER